MPGRRKKTQISVYLDPEVMAMLADYTARRDLSQSMIAEAAIASFLSPDDAERREAVVAKRPDQIDRRMTRLERDVGISIETLAVFIRFWLTTTLARAGRPGRAPRPQSGTSLSSLLLAAASPRDRNSGRRYRRILRAWADQVCRRWHRPVVDGVGAKTVAAATVFSSRPMFMPIRELKCVNRISAPAGIP